MKRITEFKEWRDLADHQQRIASFRMQDWFMQEPTRFETFSLRAGDLFLDYSKNRMTAETLTLLIKLANSRGLSTKIQDLFSGTKINTTENRPALHTALRDRKIDTLLVDEQDILSAIRDTHKQMQRFVEQIHAKQKRGATGQAIEYIINIGIGGSHLGPFMAVNALQAFQIADLKYFFISNIDNAHIQDVLAHIEPEKSLFIISSKSFTTIETMTNATSIKSWLQKKLNRDVTSHFVAVTACEEKALAFGIPKSHIFPLWDWVGGRYSIWSAIGLPLAIMIGMDNFFQFLEGAYEMDQHFRYTKFQENMPIILALIGIWYINFFHAPHHAVIPYSHRLNYLRAYLQQLDMESNGKNITEKGDMLEVATCPVLFGEQGCNGQHAFHQLLHQGTHLIPVDFIIVAEEDNEAKQHQHILVGSALSQAQALMQGKTFIDAFDELRAAGITKQSSLHLAKHKTIPGNRPSNILFVHTINPKNLGSLLALYEHKIFVQSAIWGINPFDQWGVELGKELLPIILEDLSTENMQIKNNYDPSTAGLINYYKNLRNI